MLLLLLFLFFSQTSATPKMIIFWGTPVTPGASEYISDWEDCIDQCLEEDSCVFLAKTDENGCDLYRFGNISMAEKLDEGSGKVVAMKLDSDTCPVSPLFLSGTYQYSDSINDILYSTTITSNNSFLNFQSEISYPPCPLGSRRFTRGDTKVCLQIRFFTSEWCGNYTDASALCRESNGIIITGPDSDEEWQYFKAETTRDKIMATGTPEQYSKLDLVFWIDGWCYQSKCEKDEFTMEDSTHNEGVVYPYPWFGEPNQGINACTYFPYKGKVDDHKCKDGSGSSYCFRGAACRIEPLEPFE